MTDSVLEEIEDEFKDEYTAKDSDDGIVALFGVFEKSTVDGEIGVIEIIPSGDKFDVVLPYVDAEGRTGLSKDEAVEYVREEFL